MLRGAADDHDAVEVQRRLEDLAGRHAAVARGTLVVVVSQGGDTGSVLATAREVIPDATSASGPHGPGCAARVPASSTPT